MKKNKFWCTSGVSIRSPFIPDTYINDLPDGIMSICKIFADDTSLFSKIIDTRNSQNTLNSDLEIIKNCAYRWKIQLNPDPKKQMRLSFLRNQIDVHALQSHSIIILSLHVLIKSTWMLSLIQN